MFLIQHKTRKCMLWGKNVLLLPNKFLSILTHSVNLNIFLPVRVCVCIANVSYKDYAVNNSNNNNNYCKKMRKVYKLFINTRQHLQYFQKKRSKIKRRERERDPYTYNTCMPIKLKTRSLCMAKVKVI